VKALRWGGEVRAVKRHLVWVSLAVALGCARSDSGPRTLTASGTVLQDALTPTGGVTVRVLLADGTPTGEEATSDSAGRFAVEVPAESEVYFKCTATGCSATNSRIMETRESALDGVELWVFTIEARTNAATGAAPVTGQAADLATFGLVVGILYDESGRPVTGAEVTIGTAEPNQIGIACRDADGAYDELDFTTGFVPGHQFAAVNVPEGEFELTQDIDSHAARAVSAAGEVTAVVLSGLPVYSALVGAVVHTNWREVGFGVVNELPGPFPDAEEEQMEYPLIQPRCRDVPRIAPRSHSTPAEAPRVPLRFEPPTLPP
jgi:hypothetical protein